MTDKIFLMTRALRSVLFIQVVALSIFVCADTEASVIDSKDVPESIPVTIPISATDFCPPEGACSIYVIYGQYVSGEHFVAKYGMTCQKDSKPNVNPRPACQVRRLNRALAEKLLDPLNTAEGNPEQETKTLNETKLPQIQKYFYAKVISGVDKTTALLIERAMVAEYVRVNQQLPLSKDCVILECEVANKWERY